LHVETADQPANMDRTGMDIVDGGSLDLVGKVMSVNGDTDAAVEVTVHTTTTTTSV